MFLSAALLGVVLCAPVILIRWAEFGLSVYCYEIYGVWNERGSESEGSGRQESSRFAPAFSSDIRCNPLYTLLRRR
ncbi:hypothetical protein B0H66DRAFT_300569 [Apodospora peruviana]|uniref:Uncharacterized protein n=1 Tax=Apodospora peruviana TaxID=516989 RepID=A0AAE0M298_9PEZI|nr:hypothetical protein B0H66DRAFT_300569 [Apodospora peruviana]